MRTVTGMARCVSVAESMPNLPHAGQVQWRRRSSRARTRYVALWLCAKSGDLRDRVSMADLSLRVIPVPNKTR